MSGIFLYFGSNQFVAFAVDVDDFNRGIVFQMLAELGDIDVHRAGVEVIVINPDGFQRIVALEDFVHVGAQKAEKFGFLGCQLGHFVADHQHLLLGVESEFADFIHGDFFPLLAADTAQDCLDTEHKKSEAKRS